MRKKSGPKSFTPKFLARPRPSKPPEFPETAIRKSDQVRPGMVIVVRVATGTHDVFRVLTAPEMRDGTLLVRVEDPRTEGGTDRRWLADMGVVPYKGGSWNATNWTWGLSEFQRLHDLSNISEHDKGGRTALAMTI